MDKGEIIRYNDMVMQENCFFHRGMNFDNSRVRGYHVVLMSVRKNAPYADEWDFENEAIIYEGHDVQKNYNNSSLPQNKIDQPLYTPSGSLTQNGKFYNAAKRHQNNKEVADIVKVYQKISSGIWVYNGFFDLVDADIVNTGIRKVFKFKLKMRQDSNDLMTSNEIIKNLEAEHNRLIPTHVKQKVYARDKGQCVNCGSNINLHYDHILPFSKGGSSVDANNIQILCQKCNLEKSSKIQ